MNTGQIAIPKRLAYASIAVLGILIAVFLFAGNFSAFDFGRSETNDNCFPQPSTYCTPHCTPNAPFGIMPMAATFWATLLAPLADE